MTGKGAQPSVGSVESQAVEWLSMIRATGEAHRAAFEAWYTADVAHADAYDALLESWDKTARVHETDEGRARLAGRKSSAMRPRWIGYALAAAAAFLAVVAIAAGLAGFSVMGRSSGTEVASRVGELRTVTLADGSRVTLDTDTLIRTAFTTNLRHVQLARGRARFDVFHDAARPFVVTADGGSVTAHGTVFDVAYVDRRVTVALLRGSVEVRKLGGADADARGRFLLPGQGIGLSETSSLSMPRRLDRAETQWTTGMLSFANTPLADAVAAANRYSRAKIQLHDSAALRFRVTGRFPANDIHAFAASLAAAFDLPLGHDLAGNPTLGSPAT